MTPSAGTLATLVERLAQAPTDIRPRPLTIMTGHQAEFWHPGILAKYFAADSIARALASRGVPATTTWLVVDQDSNQPWKIPYPARNSQGLRRATWEVPLQEGLTPHSDTPAAALSPLNPPTDSRATIAGLEPATPGVAAGLASISSRLTAHINQPNAARQVTHALCDLLAPWVSPGNVMYATDLAKSPMFIELVERMRSDPASCAKAYNAAAAQVPEARVRPLIIEPTRTELPLWHMPTARGQPRRPAFAPDLGPASTLAPRALLMTALVRLSACDLFIHGTGGGLYDRITELWLAAWLPGRTLAPTTVVTATRHLDFGELAPRTPQAIAGAVWEAHHAAHNPGSLGDTAAQQRKQEVLASLRTARAHGRDPREDFQALHALLSQSRSRNTAQLATLSSAAAAARQDSQRASIVYERTWPFPLHDASAITQLKQELDTQAGLLTPST